MRWAIAVLAGCGRFGFDPGIDAIGGSPMVGCTAGETPGPFHSDFDTGMPDWALPYNQVPVTLAFANGVMTVSPGNSQSQKYGGISSPNADFHERRVFVEVPVMVNTTTGAVAGIGVEIGGNGQGYSDWYEQSGTLFAEIHVGGGGYDTSMIPYDPVAQRWLQVREHAGTVSFEISPDGLTWAMIAQKPTPAYYGSAYIDVFAGTDTSQTGSLGLAEFDNLFDCLTP